MPALWNIEHWSYFSIGEEAHEKSNSEGHLTSIFLFHKFHSNPHISPIAHDCNPLFSLGKNSALRLRALNLFCYTYWIFYFFNCFNIFIGTVVCSYFTPFSDIKKGHYTGSEPDVSFMEHPVLFTVHFLIYS